jgi:hypothetical protein
MPLPTTLAIKNHSFRFDPVDDMYEVMVTVWLPHRQLKPFRCDVPRLLQELYHRVEDPEVKRFLTKVIGPRILN